MSNKDFLSQFSNENNKPASFNEEVRTPVQKEKKPINPWFFIVPAIIIITIGVVLYLIFLRPNIEVVNFIGQKQSDAIAWIRQQGIESDGIVFKEEYDFDNAEGIVIDQNPTEGKVTRDAKMTFVLSQGPDPDEKIQIPNFINMDKNEISEWINKNKLLSTKINTTYSDTVENNKFISADYNDCEEGTFTRGCSLKISISKGPRPANEVEMLNFVKKNIEEFEVWAATKGILVEKIMSYSDSYPENQIMAQSAKERDVIKVGDTVTVMVSKGKAVIMEDFVGKSYAYDFSPWISKNNSVNVIRKEEYSSNYSKGDIISQSIPKGTIVENDLVIVTSLGEPDVSDKKTLEDLWLWEQDVDAKGADVHIGKVTYENNDTVPKGNIIRMNYSKYVRVGGTLNPVISLGKNIFLVDIEADDITKEIPEELSWEEASIPNRYTEDQIRSLCNFNNVTYEVKYVKKDGIDVHKVVSVTRDGGKPVVAGTYIPQSEVVKVVICDPSK